MAIRCYATYHSLLLSLVPPTYACNTVWFLIFLVDIIDTLNGYGFQSTIERNILTLKVKYKRILYHLYKLVMCYKFATTCSWFKV